MSAPRILRKDEAGACTLTLNRPDKLNALDTQAFAELDCHLADLEKQADDIGLIILRGSGRGFCAGADLTAMGLSKDGQPVNPQFKPQVIARLASLPQPVIAAVHGVCFTGGLELALACDFILADTSARFADTHGKWGLVAAWGMMQRLPRRIGVPAARRMMMTGEEISAEHAYRLGLLDVLALEGALEAELRSFSQSLLHQSWHTNFAIKRTLRDTEGMTLRDALVHENLQYPGNAPDHPERLARFSCKSGKS